MNKEEICHICNKNPSILLSAEETFKRSRWSEFYVYGQRDTYPCKECQELIKIDTVKFCKLKNMVEEVKDYTLSMLQKTEKLKICQEDYLKEIIKTCKEMVKFINVLFIEYK